MVCLQFPFFMRDLYQIREMPDFVKKKKKLVNDIDFLD